MIYENYMHTKIYGRTALNCQSPFVAKYSKSGDKYKIGNKWEQVPPAWLTISTTPIHGQCSPPHSLNGWQPQGHPQSRPFRPPSEVGGGDFAVIARTLLPQPIFLSRAQENTGLLLLHNTHQPASGFPLPQCHGPTLCLIFPRQIVLSFQDGCFPFHTGEG